MPRRSRSPSRGRSPGGRHTKKSKQSSSKSHKDKKSSKKSRRRSSTSSSSPSSSSRSPSPDTRHARRMVKAAQRFLKDRLKETGGQAASKKLPLFPLPSDPLLPPGAPSPPLITPADYFTRSREFAVWLTDARGQAFADLGPGEGRALFDGPFSAAWNAFSLPARFYDGSIGDAPGATRRTAHDWGLGKEATTTGPALASAAEEAAAWAEQRDAKAAATATTRTTHRARLEEAAGPRPDPGTHEARQAARAGRAHVAAEREASPDGPPVASLMGGGDSFAAARQREREANAWKERRAAERNAGLSAKAAAAKEAEDARMAAFRALVASGPIVIPKRAPAPE